MKSIILALTLLSGTIYGQCATCTVGQTQPRRLTFYQPPYSYLNSGQADITPWQGQWGYARPALRPRTLVAVDPYVVRPRVFSRYGVPSRILNYPPQIYYYSNITNYHGDFTYGVCN